VLFWTLVLAAAAVAGPASGSQADRVSAYRPADVVGCRSIRPRVLLGLVVRPLTLDEMVSELERGCLALDDVRFQPGQDTIISLSPSRFAQVARALGLARGAYGIAVPAEASPGGPPDTVQARRRGNRLRDELVHYGASLTRLVEDPGWPFPPQVAAPGTAVPMLVRLPIPEEPRARP
jgi:hypothetical protein